jgi:predicted Abi (CAAX) family protease
MQVVWVAKHLDGASVFYRGQQGTGIGAIVWAQTAHHGIFFKDWMGHGAILKGYFGDNPENQCPRCSVGL